jgi:4-hydroxy-3-polyprenylbenzoate decarboxylase
MSDFNRRELLGSAATLAAFGAGIEAAVAASPPAFDRAPFKSMRDYIAALEDWGIVMRIPRVDQDAYEAAALMYRARDAHGMRGGPTLFFEKVKIDGQRIDGPLLVNESGNSHAECLVFGLQPVNDGPIAGEPFNSYRRARAHVEGMLEKNGGMYPTIAPVEVSTAAAPCKEIKLTGDDIDLTKYAIIKGNPGDAGRYINTSVVFTRHPKYGVNFGTYRCHLRGPREIAINSEPGQTGFRHLKAAAARGEKVAKVSIALTPDPYVWMVSGSKMSYSGDGLVDEMSIAGGLAGQPIDVVKSETNDFMVPAHAEMIIEGEVPLDDLRPEGPYGEMVGYQGRVKQEVFWMRVTSVTHRKKPWLMNNFTGVQAGTLAAAGHARSFMRLKKDIPAIVDWFPDTRSVGVTWVSINKTEVGQGLDVAKAIAERDFFSKIVVCVDADTDVTDQEAMLAAMGARWQPFGNTHLYEKQPALPLDPSSITKGKSSKIAIDATRQWPEEGGPEEFPSLNRALLEDGAPDVIAQVDDKWGEQLRAWRPKSS